MTSTLRSFPLSVTGATPLTVTGGTGANFTTPYLVFIDMRYNNTFTLDLSTLAFTGTANILFDTRASAAIQTTGKIITIIITGFSSIKQYASTRFSPNFGLPGSVAGGSPIGALDQINCDVKRNGGLGSGASAISLISNGSKFAWIGSAAFD